MIEIVANFGLALSSKNWHIFCVQYHSLVFWHYGFRNENLQHWQYSPIYLGSPSIWNRSIFSCFIWIELTYEWVFHVFSWTVYKVQTIQFSSIQQILYNKRLIYSPGNFKQIKYSFNCFKVFSFDLFWPGVYKTECVVFKHFLAIKLNFLYYC